MQIPTNIRIEKARNDLQYQIKRIMVQYDLPDFVVDLILDAVRANELQEKLALLMEQVEVPDEDTVPNDKPAGNTDSKEKLKEGNDGNG